MKETCISFQSLPSNSTKTMWSLHLDSAGVWYKKGQHAIVAASPPTEDAVIAAEPLTKEDLVGYLASGCKPKEKWRIGTEHEKFGFEFETLRPMKYEQIAELLNGIAERFDWDKIMEGDNIIGLKQLSGAPLETLHQTCAEVNSHLYQVKAVTEEMGIGFLGIGFQPKWGLKDIPTMPKYRGRYEIMRNYMPKVGSLGLDMMFRTCTVQVNLDFSSEADMIRKFRASLALQPEFMSGKLVSIPGESPTLNDWENHLTTIFPEAGLLYDEVSLQNVLDMITDWTPKERQMLRNKHGLERRGFKETGFLNEVAEVYRTGVTPAEKLLETYHGKWGQSVDPVFEELLY
ncbi:hypothetical protein LOK49_LG13G01165 [Camellia lanceoleosa]|uniref:Uncharacterized protein n=1 Tax=Camellia lanceoleosa TaxID=1840588 RepID=A0ACC0FHX8_9ERIC|nr:hypothetical protein LOK49_LG13G01165 [Camellia lanceoleosa]